MDSERPPAPVQRARFQTPWAKVKHNVVPLLFDVVPDAILGFLVQHSRYDPGARILTAFSFASIVRQLVVATLQVVLRDKLESHRELLADPLKRRELWVLAQAAWIVYMSYMPFAGLACAYTAWRSRESILGQNADVADVVASLLVINLVALPFSLGSALLRTDLEAQKALKPFVVASVVAWTVGLSFAYVLGFYTPLGFVGIALTDIITYGIMFRLLAPSTQLLTEWPGWHLRAAIALVPKIARHPAMVGILLVNLATMLFGFTSLLASLIKVDAVVLDAQTDVFPSLLMLSFAPLVGICLRSSLTIDSTLAKAHGGEFKPIVKPMIMVIATVVLGVITTIAWVIGALHVGKQSVPSWLRTGSEYALMVLVPLHPPLGFVIAIRPVLRTCVDLWRRASTIFLVTMAIGALLGATFAQNLDGGIQGLWFGQYLGTVAFIIVAAVSIRRWVSAVCEPEEEIKDLLAPHSVSPQNEVPSVSVVA